MIFSNRSLVSRLLILGMVVVFVIVLVITWPWFKRAVPSENNNQIPQTIIERSPEEIKAGYKSSLIQIAEEINVPATTAVAAQTALDNFFFSARVPQEARDAHLKAALAFKNIDTKKSNEEKLTAYRNLVKQLQSATASL